MRILITGAHGLVGTNFIPLVQDDHEVFCLSRRPNLIGKSMGKAKWIEADLNQDAFNSQLPKEVDLVIHLAQSSKYKSGLETAGDIFGVNVKSTARLLEWSLSANINKFIYFSSGSVYRSSKTFIEEDSPLKGIGEVNYYEASKISAEYLVSSYRNSFDVKIVRPFYIYGPKQNSEMFVPSLIKRIQGSVPISLAEGVGSRLSPIFVKDVTSALLLMTNNTRNFPAITNFSGPEAITVAEIAELVGQKLHKNPIFKSEGTEPVDFYASSLTIAKLLGEPMTPFSQGLNSLIQP